MKQYFYHSILIFTLTLISFCSASTTLSNNKSHNTPWFNVNGINYRLKTTYNSSNTCIEFKNAQNTRCSAEESPYESATLKNLVSKALSCDMKGGAKLYLYKRSNTYRKDNVTTYETYAKYFVGFNNALTSIDQDIARTISTECDLLKITNR